MKIFQRHVMVIQMIKIKVVKIRIMMIQRLIQVQHHRSMMFQLHMVRILSSSSSNLNSSEITTTNPNSSNELVILPEISFNIRIQITGLEIFDLPVTSSELVQEIHQVLMDKEETCYRTCFSLQLEGIILDNFTELKNIEGLKEGCLLKVDRRFVRIESFKIESPYELHL